MKFGSCRYNNFMVLFWQYSIFQFILLTTCVLALGSSPGTGISWGAAAPTQPSNNMFGGMPAQAAPVSAAGWGGAPAPSAGEKRLYSFASSNQRNVFIH